MTETDIQKNKWRGRIIRYAPLVLWIGVIMFFSTSQASMSNTSRFIRPLLIFLFPNTAEETLIIYHSYIRKFAHVAVYSILAFWACRAFSNSSQNLLRSLWFAFAFILVLLVASVDETNQSFLSSRTGSIYDVLIDVTGGTAMILIFYSLMRYRRRAKI
jgi:VanZ family protein